MLRELGAGSDEDRARVRALDSDELVASLLGYGLSDGDAREAASTWPQARDGSIAELAAAVLSHLDRVRGDVDAPFRLWPDLDDEGSEGRLFYLYLFVLAAPLARRYLSERGASERLIADTFADLARHVDIYRRKYGSLGVDAGWWQLLVLRGVLVQVGSLQFHRQHLGVGALAPDPWYSADEVAKRGVGFAEGDEALGLHVPRGVDLSPDALDETVATARQVLGSFWPCATRRLAICQSWLLDDRLGTLVGEASNIVQFQHRFTLVPGWVQSEENLLDFVFLQPGRRLEDLVATTSLQRAIVDFLRRGNYWRDRVGWFFFDGSED